MHRIAPAPHLASGPRIVEAEQEKWTCPPGGRRLPAPGDALI